MGGLFVFKVKVLVTIGVFFMLFGAAVLTHSLNVIGEARFQQAENQARLTVSGIQQSIQTEFSRLRVLPGLNAEALGAQKDIYAFVMAQLPSEKSAEKKIQIERNEVFQNFHKPTELAQLLEKQVLKKIQTTSMMFVSILSKSNPSSPQKTALVFAWKDQSKVYMYLADIRVFQKVIEIFKAPQLEITLTNPLSEVLAHHEEAYVGSALVESTFTEQALESASFGSGFYDLIDNKSIYGFYEKVPQTNLTLLYSLPQSMLTVTGPLIFFQFGMILLGFFLMTAGLVHFFFKQHDDTEHQLRFENIRLEKEVSDLLHREKLKPQPQAETITPPLLVNESERQELSMRALKKMVASLAHEINPSLLQMLGIANLIREEKNPQKLITFSDQISTEIRRVKSTLEKIFNWSGEKQEPRSQSLVSMPLVQALNHFQGIFQKSRIELIQDYNTTSKVLLSPTKLQRAFEEILQNCVDALERVESKRVDVSVFDDHSEVVVKVIDNGEGVDPRYVDRIFEPFFTTRSHRKKQGLGLSAVMGILKEQGARVKVDSERGKFTSVEIRFDSLEKQVDSTPPQTVVSGDQAQEMKPLQASQIEESDYGFTKVPLTASNHTSAQDSREDSSPQEIDLDELLQVPAGTTSLTPDQIPLVEGVHVDRPKFKFQKRPSLLDDHVVNIPQQFQSKNADENKPS